MTRQSVQSAIGGIKTITLQIRNAHGLSSQQEWWHFFQEIDEAVKRYACKIEYFDAPPAEPGGETACWVFHVESDEKVKAVVSRIRMEYGQEPAAWTEWNIEFI